MKLQTWRKTEMAPSLVGLLTKGSKCKVAIVTAVTKKLHSGMKTFNKRCIICQGGQKPKWDVKDKVEVNWKWEEGRAFQVDRIAWAKALQKRKLSDYMDWKRSSLAQRDRMRGRVVQNSAGEMGNGQTTKGLGVEFPAIGWHTYISKGSLWLCVGWGRGLGWWINGRLKWIMQKDGDNLDEDEGKKVGKTERHLKGKSYKI